MIDRPQERASREAEVQPLAEGPEQGEGGPGQEPRPLVVNGRSEADDVVHDGDDDTEALGDADALPAGRAESLQRPRLGVLSSRPAYLSIEAAGVRPIPSTESVSPKVSLDGSPLSFGLKCSSYEQFHSSTLNESLKVLQVYTRLEHQGGVPNDGFCDGVELTRERRGVSFMGKLEDMGRRSIRSSDEPAEASPLEVQRLHDADRWRPFLLQVETEPL